MNWAAVAQVTGMRLCTGECGGQNEDHKRGYARDGTIHWSPRRVTRLGIRKFLMLAAAEAVYGVTDMPLWEYLWSMNAYAIKKARELGLRLPRQYSALDRSAGEQGNAETRLHLGVPLGGTRAYH